MPIISSHTDKAALTHTYIGEFAADVDRVWQLWADRRQLERWYGPPEWPATFDEHDFVVGGESKFHMTGPEGEVALGWWTTTAVSPPNLYEYEEGFAGEDGEPLELDPTRVTITIESTSAGARVTWVVRFPDPGQQEQMLAMGMAADELKAMAQIDAVLATPAAQE